MAHYIGLDVGTGSARACLIDEKGDILSVAVKDIKTWHERADYYEQSTEDIWSACCHVTKQVIKEADVDPKSIKGIGFDATCSLAVLDENDSPVSVSCPDFKDTNRNIILWCDHRARDETNVINDTKHPVLAFQGGTMSLEMEIPKILWLKNHLPEETFNKCKFYDLPDYLTHRATEFNETRSYCSLVCKLAYVPEGVEQSRFEVGWQRDFLDKIGLKEMAKNLKALGVIDGKATVLSAGEKVGYLSEQSAQELGLHTGVAVGSGVIDAYAGWVGTAAARVPQWKGSHKGGLDEASTRIASVCGTSTCHLVINKNAIFTKGVWGPYRQVLIPGYWIAEGGQSATGSLLHHVMTTHAAYPTAKKAAEKNGITVFEYLNDHLEGLRSQAKSPTLAHLTRYFSCLIHAYSTNLVYPDFSGNRSPLADSNLRGTIHGLTLEADLDTLAFHYYATIEAIGHQTKHIIDCLNEAGHQIKSIFMSGGQCKNNLLIQTISNCTNLPVVTPYYIEAAVCLGAAMLGMKAASEEKLTLWDVMSRLSKDGTVIHPTMDKVDKRILRAKYTIFRDMADTQTRYRKEIDDALKNPH